MTPSSSRLPLPNGFAPLSLLVALTVMLTSPSRAFVLHLPAAKSIGRTSISSCGSTLCFRRPQWVCDRFGSSTSTAAAAQGVAAAEVSGEFWALRGRRGQRASTVTSMTASSHRQNHQSSSSAPIIGTTAGKAPPPPATVTGALTDEGIPRKRRRRPMIGAVVWAEFKEEQKGVTRALLGLPAEAGSDATTDAAVLGRAEGAPRQLRPAPRPTLGAFMAETRSRNPEMEAMVPIMKAVGKTCTAVSRLVRRAQVDGMAGLHQESADTDGGGGEAAESVNVQGEVQKELDVLSNSIFLTGLCQPHSMSCVASEEEETPRMCAAVVGEEMHGGEYAAVFDPLDGSANIEAGLPCGTIFGILRTSGSAREGRKAGPGTIVLPGRRLVAAGYCLYGPSTKLVFTLGNGVFEFTLEGEGAAEQGAGRRRETGNSGSGSGGGGSGSGLGGGNLNFVLSRSNIRMPQSGKVYSVNEANSPSWSEAIQDYFRDLKTSMINDDDDDDSSQTARGGDVENQYAGALVADIHNILIHGGVFAYPADVHNPNGKLRLLYEGNPMAMIIEEAGGVATTGFERIMDIRPQSVHHRIPAFFGSPENLLPLLNPQYLDSRRKR